MSQASFLEGEVSRLISLAEQVSGIPSSEVSWHRGVRFSFDRARLNDLNLPKEVGNYLSSSPGSSSKGVENPQFSLETSKARNPSARMGIGSYFDSRLSHYLPWGIRVTESGVEVIPEIPDFLQKYIKDAGTDALVAGFLHLAEELITSPYHPPQAICIPPDL